MDNKNPAPLSLKGWVGILHRLGVSIHKVEKRRYHVRFRRRFFYLLVGGLIFAVVFLLAGAKYSESPSFCNSCHIMEPYYRAWKGSKHNKVACVECHYPPASPRTLLWKKFQALSQVAKYVTRTYSSKPFAEVEDSACLKCHSTRLLEGKLVTKRGIKFDHAKHLTEERRDRHLTCTSCHAQMVVGNHMEVSWDTCYLCHFKGMGEGKDIKPLAGCQGCHELPQQSFKVGNMSYNHKEFVTQRGVSCQNCHVEAVQGKGEATQDRCFTCHNQPEKLARIGDIPFLHENHVTKHNVACFHCHKEIRHDLRLGEKSHLGPWDASASTPSAHPPTLTFDCAHCHENKHLGQKEMYSGRVASLGLPEMPSPMFEAQVDCVGCHTQKKADGDDAFNGRTFRASTSACVKCHGAALSGVWEDTKTELNTTLAALDVKLAAAHAAAEKADLPAGEKKALRDNIAKAAQWQRFVRQARGEHNIYLAAETLRREDKALSEAGEKLGAPLPDLSGLPLLSGGFCATLCHQKVGVKVPPEKVRFSGKEMPHKTHTDMMGCVACHELGGHKKVPLRKDHRAVCETCHPT